MTVVRRADERRVLASRTLRGEIRLPSDKSIGHRALLFNAMACGHAEVTLHRPGADLRSTIRVLELLGSTVDSEVERAMRMVPEATGPVMAGESTLRVMVRGAGAREAAELPAGGSARLDCGNSGTLMRLLCGALAGRAGRQITELIGDVSLSARPMERVAGPLRAMGAHVVTTNGYAPVRVGARRPLQAVRHDIPVASAQVLGAIALAALAAEGKTVITTPTPTRDHTERLLAWLNASVERKGRCTTVAGPSGMVARSIDVPGDISSAAVWLVAAALHPDAELRLTGVGLNPTRTAVIDVLREMGADIVTVPHAAELAVGPLPESPEPVGDLSVRSAGRLRAISLSGNRVAALIDELPLLAVAMAGAEGSSELRDAGELRIKESDRISLVVRHLVAMGARAEELPDGWRVTGGTAPQPVEVTTGADHRIGMAFAVAALTGVSGHAMIDDPACIDVSYPGFLGDLAVVSDSITSSATR